MYPSLCLREASIQGNTVCVLLFLNLFPRSRKCQEFFELMFVGHFQMSDFSSFCVWLHKLIRKYLHCSLSLLFWLSALVQVVTTATEQTVGGTVTLINSIQNNTNSTVVYHVIVGDKHTQEHLRTWLASTTLKFVPVNIVNLPHSIIPPSAKHPVSIVSSSFV